MEEWIMEANSLPRLKRFFLLSVPVLMSFGLGVLVASLGRWNGYGVVIGGSIVGATALFCTCMSFCWLMKAKKSGPGDKSN
jgi:hypothetical protein